MQIAAAKAEFLSLREALGSRTCLHETPQKHRCFLIVFPCFFSQNAKCGVQATATMFAVMNGFIIATILSSASSRHRYKERMDMIVVSTPLLLHQHAISLSFLLSLPPVSSFCAFWCTALLFFLPHFVQSTIEEATSCRQKALPTSDCHHRSWMMPMHSCLDCRRQQTRGTCLKIYGSAS